MVRVRVVEAYDVQTALAPLPLDAHQLLRGDAVAVVRRIGAGIAGPDGLHHLIDALMGAAQQHTATLVRIGFFTMFPQCVVDWSAELQHCFYSSSQKRSLRYLSAESGRMVTIIASRPRAASSSAICSAAATAPAADTPTSRPSRRASCLDMA